MSTEQHTLDGEETDELPTQYWCDRCEAPHLALYVTEHGHGDYLYESREVAEMDESKPITQRKDPDGDDEDEDPEKVGEMFRVDLSYSVDYSFQVPAFSEHQAKDRAKDLVLESEPWDMMLVHKEINSNSEIYEDDEKVPDSYDPYGSEMLWEVYGKNDTSDKRTVSNFPFGKQEKNGDE